MSPLGGLYIWLPPGGLEGTQHAEPGLGDAQSQNGVMPGPGLILAPPSLPPSTLSLWQLRVQLGVSTLYSGPRSSVSLAVRRVVQHPAYNGDALQGADLALLQLERPVPLSLAVKPITLAPPGSNFPPGTLCWVTGWGDVAESGKCRGRVGQVPQPHVCPILSSAQPVSPTYSPLGSRRGVPGVGGSCSGYL